MTYSNLTDEQFIEEFDKRFQAYHNHQLVLSYIDEKGKQMLNDMAAICTQPRLIPVFKYAKTQMKQNPMVAADLCDVLGKITDKLNCNPIQGTGGSRNQLGISWEMILDEILKNSSE